MPLLIERCGDAPWVTGPASASLTTLLPIISGRVNVVQLSFGIAVPLDRIRELISAVNPDFLINSRNVGIDCSLRDAKFVTDLGAAVAAC